ncbi:MAG TPA: hypothetical protein P5230_02995 [Candidatus Magasanikbacteria bacterium]|nr:hypothetical protein [Candidatus Magasanikbacteria bacterium]
MPGNGILTAAQVVEALFKKAAPCRHRELKGQEAACHLTQVGTIAEFVGGASDLKTIPEGETTVKFFDGSKARLVFRHLVCTNVHVLENGSIPKEFEDVQKAEEAKNLCLLAEKQAKKPCRCSQTRPS